MLNLLHLLHLIPQAKLSETRREASEARSESSDQKFDKSWAKPWQFFQVPLTRSEYLQTAWTWILNEFCCFSRPKLSQEALRLKAATSTKKSRAALIWSIHFEPKGSSWTPFSDAKHIALVPFLVPQNEEPSVGLWLLTISRVMLATFSNKHVCNLVCFSIHA